MPVNEQKAGWNSSVRTIQTGMANQSSLRRTRSLRIPSNGPRESPTTPVMGPLSTTGSTLTRTSSIRWNKPSSPNPPLNNHPMFTRTPQPPSLLTVKLKNTIAKESVQMAKMSKSFIYNSSLMQDNCGKSSYKSDDNLPSNFTDGQAVSPVSNSSSIDSSTNSSNHFHMSQFYGTNATNLRRLTEEHEKLQMEYAKVRKQLMELSTNSPQNRSHQTGVCKYSDCPNLSELLSRNKLVENYQTEITNIKEELRNLKKNDLFHDKTSLLASKESGSESVEPSSLNGGSLNSFNYDSAKLVDIIKKLESKVKELESDNKEAREQIEFTNSEMNIMIETLKETEDKFKHERQLRQQEFQSLNELGERSTKLYEKTLAKNERIKALEAENTELKEQSNKLKEEINQKEVQFNAAKKKWTEFEGFLKEALKVEESLESPDYKMLIETELKNNVEEIRSLKEDVEIFLTLNMKLKNELKIKDNEIVDLKTCKEELGKKISFFEEKCKSLDEELQESIEKYTCSQNLVEEFKGLLRENFTDDTFKKYYDASELKQELERYKENLIKKDEQLSNLALKYKRNRLVWEENEERRIQEIKKLDEVIDKVISTLKDNVDTIDSNNPLKLLYIELTNGVID